MKSGTLYTYEQIISKKMRLMLHYEDRNCLVMTSSGVYETMLSPGAFDVRVRYESDKEDV
jgi:hypothetical protein